MAGMTKEKLAKANELNTQIELLTAKLEALDKMSMIRVHTSPSEFIQLDEADVKLHKETIKSMLEDKLAKTKQEFENLGN